MSLFPKTRRNLARLEGRTSSKRLASLTRLEEVGPHHLITVARQDIKRIEKELDKIETSDFADWPKVSGLTTEQIIAFERLADAYETMRDHIQGNVDNLRTHRDAQEALQK